MHIISPKKFLFLSLVTHLPFLYAMDQNPIITIYGKEGIDTTIDVNKNTLMISKALNPALSSFDTLDSKEKLCAGPFPICIIEKVLQSADAYQNAMVISEECQKTHYGNRTQICCVNRREMAYKDLNKKIAQLGLQECIDAINCSDHLILPTQLQDFFLDGLVHKIKKVWQQGVFDYTLLHSLYPDMRARLKGFITTALSKKMLLPSEKVVPMVREKKQYNLNSQIGVLLDNCQYLDTIIHSFQFSSIDPIAYIKQKENVPTFITSHLDDYVDAVISSDETFFVMTWIHYLDTEGTSGIIYNMRTSTSIDLNERCDRIAINKQNTLIATSGNCYNFALWDISDIDWNNPPKTLKPLIYIFHPITNKYVTNFAFSDDGRWLIGVMEWYRYFFIWDIKLPSFNIYSLLVNKKNNNEFIKLKFSDYSPGCIISSDPQAEYNLFEHEDSCLLQDLSSETYNMSYTYDTYAALMVYNMYLKAKQKKNIWLSDYEKKLFNSFDETFQNRLIKMFPTLQLNVNFEPVIEDMVIEKQKIDAEEKNRLFFWPCWIPSHYTTYLGLVGITLGLIYYCRKNLFTPLKTFFT